MSKYYRRFRAENPEPKEAQQGKCQDLVISSAFNSYCLIYFPVLVMSGDFDHQFSPCITVGNARAPPGQRQRAAQQCCAQHPNTRLLCPSTLGAFNCGVHNLSLVHFIADR